MAEGTSGPAAPEAAPEERARARLSLRRDVSLWQASFWPETFADGAARLGAALGAALPPPGRSAAGPQGRLIRARPLVWQILDAPAEEDGGPPPALRGIGPETGAVAELGPGLARIAVQGPAAAELMARAVPLDLRPAAFPAGAVAVTGWRRASVTVLRPETGGFQLLVPLSFAEDMAALLALHARQFA